MPLYELSFPEKGKAPYPLILILPVLGRILCLPDFWIEKKLAQFFNRRGFAAAIVVRDFFEYAPAQGIEQVGKYLSAATQKAKTALDELLKIPQIDSNRIGSLGISFGGVLNVLFMAEEPRIQAGVIALAGGNLPEIITTSRDPLVKNYCKTILNGLGLNREEFVRRLKEELEEEPLRFAPAVDPNKILMIIAQWDRVVFPRYSLNLRKALQNPETVFLPLGHYFSLLAMPYLERKALRFFQQKFNLERLKQ